MSDMKTALLVLDFQTGLADAPFAKGAVAQASVALQAARKHALPVYFSKSGFRAGYPEVAESNPVFLQAKQKQLFQIGSSNILPELTPLGHEPVVIKSRFSAFTGTDLSRMLRAGGIEELVIAGVSTSGVVLSAFCTTADEDYRLIVLADACADPKQALHNELMANLFPRSAKVVVTKDWVTSLGS